VSTPTSPTTSPDRSARTGGRRSADRPRRRRLLLGGLAGLLVLTMIGLAPILVRAAARDGVAPAVDGVDRVELVGSRFDPPAVRIPAGGTVTFVWADGQEHDVRFDDGPWERTRSDGTWARTFDEPGIYPLRCTLHPFMDGRIEVTG
jgi:plastocyanin